MSKYIYKWKRTKDTYRQAASIGRFYLVVAVYRNGIGVCAEVYFDSVCTHFNRFGTITEAKMWCESIVGGN